MGTAFSFLSFIIQLKHFEVVLQICVAEKSQLQPWIYYLLETDTLPDKLGDQQISNFIAKPEILSKYMCLNLFHWFPLFLALFCMSYED